MYICYTREAFHYTTLIVVIDTCHCLKIRLCPFARTWGFLNYQSISMYIGTLEIKTNETRNTLMWHYEKALRDIEKWTIERWDCSKVLILDLL